MVHIDVGIRGGLLSDDIRQWRRNGGGSGRGIWRCIRRKDFCRCSGRSPRRRTGEGFGRRMREDSRRCARKTSWRCTGRGSWRFGKACGRRSGRRAGRRRRRSGIGAATLGDAAVAASGTGLIALDRRPSARVRGSEFELGTFMWRRLHSRHPFRDFLCGRRAIRADGSSRAASRSYGLWVLEVLRARVRAVSERDGGGGCEQR